MPWSRKRDEQIAWRHSLANCSHNYDISGRIDHPRLLDEFECRLFELDPTNLISVETHPSLAELLPEGRPSALTLMEFVAGLTVLSRCEYNRSKLLDLLIGDEVFIGLELTAIGQDNDHLLSVSRLDKVDGAKAIYMSWRPIGYAAPALPLIEDKIEDIESSVDQLVKGSGSHLTAYAIEIAGHKIDTRLSRIISRELLHFAPRGILAQMSESTVMLVCDGYLDSDHVITASAHLGSSIQNALIDEGHVGSVTVGTSTTGTGVQNALDLLDQAMSALVVALQANDSSALYDPQERGVTSLESLRDRLSMSIDRNVLPVRIRKEGMLAIADIHWFDAQYGFISVSVARGVVQRRLKSRLSMLVTEAIKICLAQMPEGSIFQVNSWLLTFADLTLLKRYPSVMILDGDSEISQSLPIPLLFWNSFQ